MKSLSGLFVIGFFMLGCQPDFNHQKRINPYAESPVFADQSGARPLPEGVVSRTEPAPRSQITTDLLLRGQDRYRIYCQVCHGTAGRGDGLVTKRGYPEAPSFHTARMRAASLEQIESVIRSGQGIMKPFGAQLDARDRQAVAAYVHVLQLSQHWPLSQLSEADQRRVRSGR